MARVVSPRVELSAPVSFPYDFYREEFMRHRECLKRQREYFSERAISDADRALVRILAQLDQLCAKDDADQLISSLLRKFNAVTNLSGWADPKTLVEIEGASHFFDRQLAALGQALDEHLKGPAAEGMSR